jgi:hypothetical protein
MKERDGSMRYPSSPPYPKKFKKFARIRNFDLAKFSVSRYLKFENAKYYNYGTK